MSGFRSEVKGDVSSSARLDIILHVQAEHERFYWPSKHSSRGSHSPAYGESSMTDTPTPTLRY